MGRFADLIFHDWRGTKQVSIPYRAFMPHPLEGWRPAFADEEAEAVRRGADSAAALMSRPDWRSLSPSADWVMRRFEGVASSGIEGIRSTLRSLTAHEQLRGRRARERSRDDYEIAGGWQQVRAALGIGARRHHIEVTVGDILSLHKKLMDYTDLFTEGGRLRRVQNWVGERANSPDEARYVPPPPEAVPEMMEDCARYISKPPDVFGGAAWARAAIAHAQFESIHPFVDGNGRTGRAIFHLMLRRAGLVGDAPLPVSASLEARRDDYYLALDGSRAETGASDHAARSQAMAAWMRLWGDAVHVACEAAASVLDKVADIERSWAELRLRANSAAQRGLEVMSTCPVMTAPDLAERLQISENAARRGLKQLLEQRAVSLTDQAEMSGDTYEITPLLDLVDRRDDTLAAIWDRLDAGHPLRLESRGGLGVAGPTRIGSLNAPAPPLPPAPAAICRRVGPRSGLPCVLARGHAGQHRYRR